MHVVGIIRLVRCITLLLVCTLYLTPYNGFTQESAVAVVYHGLGDVNGATTSLSDFESHLSLLASPKYEVLSLPQVVNSLRTDSALPEYTVAITFDGAHISIYKEAWPG